MHALEARTIRSRGTSQKTTHDLLGRPAGVDVGRVDEGTATVEERLQDVAGCRFVASPLRSAEIERTERDARDQQTGRTKEPILHCAFLLSVK
jgi:hypothetical protein